MSFQLFFAPLFVRPKRQIARSPVPHKHATLHLEELEPRLPPAATGNSIATVLANSETVATPVIPAAALINGAVPETANAVAMQSGNAPVLTGPGTLAQVPGVQGNPAALVFTTPTSISGIANTTRPTVGVGATTGNVTPMWIELVGGSGEELPPPGQPVSRVPTDFPIQIAAADGETASLTLPSDLGAEANFLDLR
jgi:hypothetical protein